MKPDIKKPCHLPEYVRGRGEDESRECFSTCLARRMARLSWEDCQWGNQYKKRGRWWYMKERFV
jgi:hypothetical protein